MLTCCVNELLCISQPWLWIRAVLFTFCPIIPKIKTRTPLGLISWSTECLMCAQALRCCKKSQFHVLWHWITAEHKVQFYWGFILHQSRAWNMCELANSPLSCLWIALWVWHVCLENQLFFFCLLFSVLQVNSSVWRFQLAFLRAE